MQGDFSRVTFDPAKHFSTVLSQQGRVQLDADTNEQAAILLHYLRRLATDLIGPAGCPQESNGFEIYDVSDTDFWITAGRMYVDGLLVENDEATTYFEQPDGHLARDDDRLPDPPYLVYLRVWERLITSVEDSSIREVALGDHGPDTSARSRVVWQLAVLEEPSEAEPPEDWLTYLRERFARTSRMPKLSATAKRPDDAETNVCEVDPESGYRGLENQLYRVEVHSGGVAGDATFKWSRENGSVLLPIESIAEDMVTLDANGRDSKLGLEVGDMVEIVDDAYASRVADDPPPEPDDVPKSPRLYQVKAIDQVARMVTLDVDEGGSLADDCGGVGTNPDLHPFLRRWEHQPECDDGAIPIEEGEPLSLEDGVTVRFEPSPENDDGGGRDNGDNGNGSPVIYRRGDFWLIPARVILGDVDWPKENGQPMPLEPHGVTYHYAPLAYVNPGSDREPGEIEHLRLHFQPVTVLTDAVESSAELAIEGVPEAQEEAPPPERRTAKKAAAKRAPAAKKAAKKASDTSSES